MIRQARIAVVITLALVEPATACRLFHYWAYPWPQRCYAGVAKQVNAAVLRPAHLRVRAPPPAPSPLPLPELEPVDWGESADDNTRGRLMLRVILMEKRQ